MSFLNAYDPNAQVGIAGSAPQMPVAAPPSIPPTQFAQQQPPMGVAQNLNQGQPQGMPRPQPAGVGVAYNQGAGQPSVAGVMAEPSVGKIGMSQQDISASGGFDMKSMASALGKAAQAQAGKQRDNMAQMQTTPGQQVDMSAFGAAQGMGQPSVSNAMQTIQGFQQSPLGGGMIGGQPTRQQMMQRLQGR